MSILSAVCLSTWSELVSRYTQKAVHLHSVYAPSEYGKRTLQHYCIVSFVKAEGGLLS